MIVPEVDMDQKSCADVDIPKNQAQQDPPLQNEKEIEFEEPPRESQSSQLQERDSNS
jgi:hypothetical protein